MTTQWIDTLAGRAARGILAAIGSPPLRLVLWNGASYGPPDAVGAVRIHDRAALARLLLDVEMQAGELYAAGRLGLEGDLVPLVKVAFGSNMDGGLLQRMVPRRLLDRVLRTDPASARANAQHHYDAGNEFYALWLDERMLYTCAYFPSPTDSLEDAQLAKMDHVCRKVGLQPGERVIEAGCGWGSLALHMARYYGASVRAFNVSREQLAYAREQAEKQGLASRIEFIEDDYRNASGRCDRFVSVGMLEHVGLAHYRDLGRVIERTLERQGTGFVHTIGRARARRLSRWITHRIFPNAYAPSLSEMMQIFEPFDFAVLDVENLRRHYALTLRHWLARYERSLARIEGLVGAEQMRAWRLYLAGSVAAFELGTLQLFQVVFSRSDNARIPWTRVHQYIGDEPDWGPQSEVPLGAL
jgi:cyclopropane-fatty-acyl-phospholipid synthase